MKWKDASIVRYDELATLLAVLIYETFSIATVQKSQRYNLYYSIS
jgi:hypothetical protein